MLRLTILGFVFLGFATWATVSAYGQDQMQLPRLAVGATVTAQGNMHLRKTPPSNVAGWYSTGSKIGLVQAGEILKIMGVRDFDFLFLDQQWVNVKRSNQGVLPAEGWLYNGGLDYLSVLAGPDYSSVPAEEVQE